MLDDAIKTFFSERKADWLKKKLKTGMTDEEKEQIENECEEKFSLDNWLPDAARRAGQLNMTTHPCKFSHPDAKITPTIAEASYCPDGLIRTGNSPMGELDIYGNAAALDVYKFLSLTLSDGKTILEHVELGSETIKKELNISTASFDEIKEGLLAIKLDKNPIKTSGTIKQVYFPHKDDYHLLSILTHSGLIFELKHRINKIRFSDQTKKARELKKNGDYSETGFDDLFDLTMIGFGGSNKQNISIKNVRNAGTAYLLPSLPPTLKTRAISPPRKDFFETLWHTPFKSSFTALHKLLLQPHNTVSIREGRDNIISFVMDRIIDRMWMIRQQPPGWSMDAIYSSLPGHQKIWLDAHYNHEREKSDEWLDTIINENAKWFRTAYQRSIGKNAIPIGDEELRHIKKVISRNREALR